MSDADLAEANRARSFEDDSDREADSIFELVATPDLVLLQPGFLAARPKKDLVLEAVLVRKRFKRPTWLLDGPRAVLSKDTVQEISSWKQVAITL